MKLEERLFNLRKQYNKTQEQIADSLSVSRQTISNWETGNAQPTIDKASELANLYNISLDELVGETVKEKKISKLLQSLIGEVCSIYILVTDEEAIEYGIINERVFKNTKVIDVTENTIHFEYLYKKKLTTKMLFLNTIAYIEKGGN